MNRRTYSCGDDVELFFRKLPTQHGAGVMMERPLFFAGVRRQRGAGIGGIFGTLARKLLPFAKKYILPNALDAVKNIATDLSDGKNFRDSLKENAFAALKSTGDQIFNQSGSGMRGRKTGGRTAGKVVKKSSKSNNCKGRKSTKKGKSSKKTSKGKGRRGRKESSPLRSIFH